ALVVFFSGRRRHTMFSRDWSSDVCSSDLVADVGVAVRCGDRDRARRLRAAAGDRVSGRWYRTVRQIGDRPVLSVVADVCAELDEIGRASWRGGGAAGGVRRAVRGAAGEDV